MILFTGLGAQLSYQQVSIGRGEVERKVAIAQKSVRRNKFRELEGVKVRQYKPVAHDDDLFLPSRPMGSWKVNYDCGYLQFAYHNFWSVAD